MSREGNATLAAPVLLALDTQWLTRWHDSHSFQHQLFAGAGQDGRTVATIVWSLSALRHASPRVFDLLGQWMVTHGAVAKFSAQALSMVVRLCTVYTFRVLRLVIPSNRPFHV